MFFQRSRTIFWIIGPIINLYLVFGQMDKSYNVYESVLHAAFGRTAWGVGIAWVILACSTANGGKFIFLNYKTFTVDGRKKENCKPKIRNKKYTLTLQGHFYLDVIDKT